MRASEILDAQRDLLERLDDETFSTLVTSMVAQSLEDSLGVPGTVRNGEKEQALRKVMERYRGSPALLGRTLRASEVYRVSKDMGAVVEHAANVLEEEDVFDPSLAPSGCGVVFFEKPLRMVDARGKVMLTHWLIWGPGRFDTSSGIKQGTACWAFNDVWVEPDEVQTHFNERTREEDPEMLDRVSRVFGRWAMSAIMSYQAGMSVGPQLVWPNASHAKEVIAEGGIPHQGTNVLRQIQALWMMMGQTITAIEHEEADRPARKRAKRMGLPQGVTVIRLRRESLPTREPGESHVEWSHRWIVRSHWAWRRCSEQHPGAQQYRRGWGVRVWIGAYLKGPEDKPLVVTDKLYSLER